MKLSIATLAAAFLLLVTLPVLFASGDTEPAAPACLDLAAEPTSAAASIAATIRQRESGSDYQARAPGSTASGAYQFTDATWADYQGYPRAADAPPAVQDAKATEHVTGILQANNGDVGAVPVAWYIGYVPAPTDPAWDVIPHPEAGNTLTPREYQAEWLQAYRLQADATPPATVPGPPVGPSAAGCTAPEPQAPGAGVALVTVEGITVNAQIADQVATLVQAARASGYTLTGSGYRSAEEQVQLRRQHCGTSDYAIYVMPSSLCSPPTARPGSSNHEVGLAIDFTCDGTLIRSQASACFHWLADNAPTHGLHNLPSEPWHWSIDGT